MTDNLTPHLDIVLRHTAPGLTETLIPRLDMVVGQGPTGKAPCLYRSMLCFILQGSKRVSIGDTLLNYDSEQYFISALELPLMGQILDAGKGRPYVAVSLVLEPALLAELAATMPAGDESDQKGMGVAINPMTAPLRDTLLRLLSLLDSPGDIPVLGPMIERELVYRLLQGPQGRLLRQIARPDGALDRVRRAIAWIRDHPDAPLRIDALCDASGMSRASLHRHFRAMTGFSPLQYQKQLRLQEARQLLLAGGHSASDAAFAVGYESASQFSREYLRQFGAPPGRHIREMRQAVEHPTAAQAETGDTRRETGTETGTLTHYDMRT